MIFPNYNRSILSTTASILRHFGVNSLYPTLPEVDAALATGPKHVALVLADLAARSVSDGAELPVGVVTGVIGGPVFLLMLWRRYGKASV